MNTMPDRVMSSCVHTTLPASFSPLTSSSQVPTLPYRTNPQCYPSLGVNISLGKSITSYLCSLFTSLLLLRRLRVFFTNELRSHSVITFLLSRTMANTCSANRVVFIAAILFLEAKDPPEKAPRQNRLQRRVHGAGYEAENG